MSGIMATTPEKPKWIHPPERVHDILTADGRLLLRHYVFRTTDGSKVCPYKSRRKPGWVWNWTTNFLPDDVDANDLLYRLPELVEAFRGGAKTIYWTEGEKDADTLVEKAGVVAVAHHQGAANATHAQAAWLKRFVGRIVIVADWDVPGAACALRRYRLLQEIGIRKANLRIVTPAYPYREGKDASDHFAEGFGIDDFRQASRAINEVAKQHIPSKRNGGYS